MTTIQLRRGTAAAWTAANPTLASGETGFETDTGFFKIGDGSTAWASLGYAIPSGVAISALPAVTVPAGTDEFVVNQGGTSKKVTLAQVKAFDSGTAFPAAPATNDRFFRTDLGLEFFWDGTRWLTSELFMAGTSNPVLTANIVLGAPSLYMRGLDFWIEKATVVNRSIGTNSGSAYWTGTLYAMGLDGSTNTSLGTFTTAADANGPGVWIERTTVVNAVKARALVAAFQANVNKTSTPGNLAFSWCITYRLIGV